MHMCHLASGGCSSYGLSVTFCVSSPLQWPTRVWSEMEAVLRTAAVMEGRPTVTAGQDTRWQRTARPVKVKKWCSGLLSAVLKRSGVLDAY